jgi:hypothetical protein
VTSYELRAAFGSNINFLQFVANIRFIVNFIHISFSILNSQFSIVDKTRFANPRITAFFAASGQFAAKKSTFSGCIFDNLSILTVCYWGGINGGRMGVGSEKKRILRR